MFEIKSARFLLLYRGILFFDTKCKYVNRCHVSVKDKSLMKSRNSKGGQQEGTDAVTETRWCKKSVEAALSHVQWEPWAVHTVLVGSCHRVNEVSL